MPSKIVQSRLQSIVDTLLAAHRGGADVSRASKGRERELFINMVLGNIISQPFRIGSGEIVDQSDNLSGQVDIAIEYANTLSFPSVYPHSERLYLAESICAVIEVKSDLSSQWLEARQKAEKIFALSRRVGAVAYTGSRPPDKIPVFVVGYDGWASPETARKKLNDCNQAGIVIGGILQLNPCFYVSQEPEYPHSFEDVRALFGFLLSIEQLTSGMMGSKPPFKGYVGGPAAVKS